MIYRGNDEVVKVCFTVAKRIESVVHPKDLFVPHFLRQPDYSVNYPYLTYMSFES
jgi:hypothetical protein